MHCTNCGNPVSEGAKFCGKCGAKVTDKKQGVSSVETKNKEPLSAGKVVKKIFQIIAVVFFLIALAGMSSSTTSHPTDGWFGTIYDIFNITAVIAFIAMLTNAWQYRKSGPKNKNWFGWRWIIFLLIVSFVGLGTMIFSQALTVAREKAMKNPDLRAEYIKNVVEAAKSKTSFPQQVNESTMMTGISAEGNAIRYSYLLSDVDTSKLSSESLKASLTSSICQNESTKNLLAKEIDVEFWYLVKETRQSYLVHFTQSDCE